MKNDEFAFLNQQLAAMLRDGIPLEGALRQLCADMKRGALRSELEKLEADLAKGMPLREAARARQLPELYQRMLEVGVQSNNLPAVLTLLADYYQRRHTVWTKLKGLMVYPMIVLCAAFLLSCFLSILLNSFIWPNLALLAGHFPTAAALVTLWMPPCFLVLSLRRFLSVPRSRLRAAPCAGACRPSRRRAFRKWHPR